MAKRKVICLDTEIVYDSFIDAMEQTGVGSTNIRSTCNGKQKSAGGYQWAYYDNYLNGDYSYNLSIGKDGEDKKKIIDLDSLIIYNSYADASKSLNISRVGISKVCRGLSKSVGGHRFSYYSDYLKGNYTYHLNIGPGSNDSNNIKVINLNNGVVFKSVMEASKSIGVNVSTIIGVCKGKNKTAKGFQFAYYDDYLNGLKSYDSNISDEIRFKSVINVTKNITYSSISDANKKTGVDFQRISDCCKGIRRDVDGDIWRYEEDVDKDFDVSYGVVYKIENIITKEIYIGQTTQSVKKRFKDHKKDNNLIGNAIREYGVSNFKIDVLINCDNKEELDEMEYNFIIEYDSIYPKGYNKLKGKNLKVIDVNNGVIFDNVKEASIEYNTTISNIHANCKGLSHTCKGTVFKYLIDYTKKDDCNITYKTHNKKRKVRYIPTGEVFDSMSEASKLTKVSRGRIGDECRSTKVKDRKWEYADGGNEAQLNYNICRKVVNVSNGKVYNSASEVYYIEGIDCVADVCKGKRKTAGGYVWLYEDDYNNLSKEDIIKLQSIKNRLGRKVVNIDTKEVFNSTSEASDKTNINKSSIGGCCNGRNKTAGGYRWMYLDEYERIKDL